MPRCPVILNCAATTDRVSGSFDFTSNRTWKSYQKDAITSVLKCQIDHVTAAVGRGFILKSRMEMVKILSWNITGKRSLVRWLSWNIMADFVLIKRWIFLISSKTCTRGCCWDGKYLLRYTKLVHCCMKMSEIPKTHIAMSCSSSSGLHWSLIHTGNFIYVTFFVAPLFDRVDEENWGNFMSQIHVAINWHPSFYVAHKNCHIRWFDHVNDSSHKMWQMP